MVLSRKATFVIGFAVVLVAAVVMASTVLAEDVENTVDPSLVQPTEDTPQATEEPADPFAVPTTGTPDELLERIGELMKMRPEGNDQKSIMDFVRKSRPAIIEAADKILESSEVTPEQSKMAFGAKMQSISLLMRFRDPKALEMLREFPAQLEKLKKPELARMVNSQLLGLELMMATRKAPTAKPIDEVRKEIETFIGDKPDALSAGLVLSVVSNLSQMKKEKEAFDFGKKHLKPITESEEPEVAKLGKGLQGKLLGVELVLSAKKAPEVKSIEEIQKEIDTFLGDKVDADSVKFVMNAAMSLGGADKKVAAEFCERFSKKFTGSDDEKLARQGKLIEGMGRRLDLVGKPMKIVGTTVDGPGFDWSAYKGKVVLVQFWATWCGPCRGEIPNVLALYNKYHDKGFDVVGISLDRDFGALKDYIDENSMPWTNLYDGPREEGEEAGEQPNVLYYGVFGIPELILVGRDGNVIATGLRGKKLEQEIEKLFENAEGAEGAEKEAPESK